MRFRINADNPALIEDAAGFPVAIVNVPLDLRPREERLADCHALARKMACSEELLKALKQAVDRLESGYTPSPLDGDLALLNKFRAIITRADGRGE